MGAKVTLQVAPSTNKGPIRGAFWGSGEFPIPGVFEGRSSVSLPQKTLKERSRMDTYEVAYNIMIAGVVPLGGWRPPPSGASA